MKITFKIALIACSLFFITSCSKDDKPTEPNNPQNNTDTDNDTDNSNNDGDTNGETNVVNQILKENEILAYYPFNGNANDESKNSNNSKKINATLTKDRFNKADQAYDVSKGNIDIPTFEIPNKFSISAWVKTTELGSYQCIVSKAVSSREFVFRINKEKYCNCLSIHATSGSNHTTSSEAGFPTGKWTHVAMTYDDGATTIYIDGVSKASKTIDKIVWSNSDISIGSLAAGGSAEKFNGSIDDVLFASKVLSAEDVKKLAANK